MKRYFDLVGQDIVAEFDIDDGSPASKAPVKAFEKQYCSTMTEITKEKYLELKEQYEKNN